MSQFLPDLSPLELSSSSSASSTEAPASASSHSSYMDGGGGGGGAHTLHLIAYSVNQKGRSEPTLLENIAINEAEKRTGTYALGCCVTIIFALYIM